MGQRVRFRAVIEFTEWAREVLTRASEAAQRLNPDARVRLAQTAQGFAVLLTDEAEPGDVEADLGSARVLVESGVEGLVDVQDPHDRIVLRPAGSTPNARPA